MDALELLLTRRSAKPDMLGEPGPSPAQLETILRAATRVPDHKKLNPWRFVLFEGEARARFGEVLAAAVQTEAVEPPSPFRLETERGRLLRAPVVIGAISRVTLNPIAPEWEQILSCGAACFSLCLAANAMGFGTCWITEWYSYSRHVQSALGLGEGERIAGFIYIGTRTQNQGDRDRPPLDAIVSRWQGETMR